MKTFEDELMDTIEKITSILGNSLKTTRGQQESIRGLIKESDGLGFVVRSLADRVVELERWVNEFIESNEKS